MKHPPTIPNPKLPNTIFSKFIKKLLMPVTSFLFKKSMSATLKIVNTTYEVFKSVIKNWYAYLIYKFFHHDIKQYKK